MFAFDFRAGDAYHVPGGDSPAKIVFFCAIEPRDEYAGIESEVTVTITPDKAGAERLRHEKLARADAVERHAAGRKGALDQLALLFTIQTAHGRGAA